MGEKLLIVDDDAAVRRMHRRVLASEGHTVIEAADGDEALEAVSREHPALVLLDMHMPHLDGIETLSAILERNPKTKVIMITGDGNEKRAKMAMERGACDFLTKPVDIEALKASVLANLAARG